LRKQLSSPQDARELTQGGK